MKPIPRITRTKHYHRLNNEPEGSDKVVCKWHREEKKKLVIAMKRLNTRTAGGKTNIDSAFLRKYVPNRSISEIESVVELLKNKVIVNARFKLKKKRREEKNARKPIEEWTHVAASLAGTLEETISTAFSQVLIVSSTEPCTLRNGDPPQVHRTPTDGPVGRTIPLRPMPVPVQGEHWYTKTASPVQLLKTPASTTGPAKRLPAPSQVLRVPNSATCLSQQQPSPLVGTLSAATFDHPGAKSSTKSSSATSITSVPSSVSSTVASTSSAISSPTPHTLPQSTSAKECHARFGRTSKYATKDSPRTFGVKCVVDFEKIYCFLSVIQKPSQDCHLTAMESAIVLDLLMSLPEELPLLDCKKLRKHMIQVYQCLSAPVDSKMARQMFKDLKGGLFYSDRGEKSQSSKADSQSSQSYNTSTELEDSNVMPPPLNPFIVPLTLLKRRQ
ncbi:snRNA-activating protein complex subunit 2 [Archocentrus centrarchus]|uniref:snRNA-activating protein complex subunit 2 n=1 Tax=Archocentrus centrarchus TaxID=63155 RepID=UPI0011EA1032|nr:snRNA-activating protein complex subunit 2 [Archocentrus centrarchus]